MALTLPDLTKTLFEDFQKEAADKFTEGWWETVFFLLESIKPLLEERALWKKTFSDFQSFSFRVARKLGCEPRSYFEWIWLRESRPVFEDPERLTYATNYSPRSYTIDRIFLENYVAHLKEGIDFQVNLERLDFHMEKIFVKLRERHPRPETIPEYKKSFV